MTAPTDSRTGLLNHALLLFAAYGYDAVGVQQIVDSIGITKPTLYHHFGSKLGLLKALLAERLTPLHVAIETAATYRHDVAATLEAVARTTFSSARDNPELYRLYLSLWFAPAESEAYRAALPFHERHFVALETMFRVAAADHGNMAGRHRVYAATFLGMVNNCASLALSGHTELDQNLVRQAVQQFMHGIFS